MHVLLVEDHPSIVRNIRDYLDPAAYTLDSASTGAEALALAGRNAYDVILLDLMLPDMDGLEVCRQLREEFRCEVPVLMLTARDTLPDRLEGFRAGTDDYLTKPFALEELEARIHALARRGGFRQAGDLVVGPLALNIKRREVRREGRPIEVSPTGFRILLALMRASPNVVEKDDMERLLWGDQPPGPDALRAHVSALRKAVDKPFDSPLIETLYGVGLRLKADDHA